MTGQASPILAAHVQEARAAKAKNIIDMALDFTAMKWLFPKGTTPVILQQLEVTFAKLGSIREQKDYDQLHVEFCLWFNQSIVRAQKKEQREKGAAIRRSSYGQAAKVLDISAKVYVYYCAMPSPDVAGTLVPLLHGPLDNQIIKHLIERFPSAGIRSGTLQDVDRTKYEILQSLVSKEIAEDFGSAIWPVQYDDVMFRRLNRQP